METHHIEPEWLVGAVLGLVATLGGVYGIVKKIVLSGDKAEREREETLQLLRRIGEAENGLQDILKHPLDSGLSIVPVLTELRKIETEIYAIKQRLDQLADSVESKK